MHKDEIKEQINYLQELADQTRYKAAYGYPYFILWGIAWIIGYLGSISYSQIWLYVLLGVLAVYFLLHWRQKNNQDRDKTITPSTLSKKVYLLMWILLIAAAILFVVFSWQIESDRLLNAYWPFQIGIIYVATGLFMGKKMMKIGIWLIIASFIGLWLPLFFNHIWFALAGGCGLLFTGFYFRRQVKTDE